MKTRNQFRKDNNTDEICNDWINKGFNIALDDLNLNNLQESISIAHASNLSDKEKEKLLDYSALLYCYQNQHQESLLPVELLKIITTIANDDYKYWGTQITNEYKKNWDLVCKSCTSLSVNANYKHSVIRIAQEYGLHIQKDEIIKSLYNKTENSFVQTNKKSDINHNTEQQPSDQNLAGDQIQNDCSTQCE